MNDRPAPPRSRWRRGPLGAGALRPRPFRSRHVPLRALVPNVLTLLALCSGMTAIRLGAQEQWQLAVAAIGVAAVLDALDGRVARLLKATSRFGAELDSLSDFICFGVAPALLMHQWVLGDIPGLGWTVALAFAVCAALRLARFNTALEDVDRPAWASSYFVGVPAPAGAGLALLPMVLSFEVGEIVRSPWFCGPVVVGVGLLMVSRIPTWSFKGVRVARDWALTLLVGAGLFAALVVSNPWWAMLAAGSAYLAMIPFAWRAHRRRLAEVRAAPAVAADAPEDSTAT